MRSADSSELINTRNALLLDFWLFHRVMFEKRTGRPFMISQPEGNESHFITVAREFTDIFLGRTNRLAINLPPGWAKAIDIDTPILTSHGWEKASDIKIGDLIVGSAGWTKVLGVHPQGKVSAKKVIFSDHSYLICNADHKWGVYDRYTPKLKVKKTSELEKSIYEGDKRKHWRIPLIDGNFGDSISGVDPYLIGCWLGDGHSHYAAITTMDEEIVDAFSKAGHIMRPHKHQRGKATTYGITNNGFLHYLRTSHQLSSKHFPKSAYLWCKEDRIKLIQGLMDTDGTCDNSGEASFCNKNITLIEGMEFLIASIGGITRRISSNGSIKLKIRVPENTVLFRLKRKQDKLQYHRQGLPKRLIKEISNTESREMVCFTVDAEDQLFAAGHQLILTHNSEMCKSFIAWCMAHYPMSKFLYISHSFDLATMHTSTIKQMMSMPIYKALFGVEIRRDSSAKDFFQTTEGGAVAAFGSQGGITGHDAGLPGLDHFSGAAVIDDIHKPEDIHSDTIRDRVKRNYFETIERRLRSPTTPIILFGQRLHEDDLFAHLFNDTDGQEWKKVIIKALDDSGNARYPEVNPKQQLLTMREKQPYVYYSQYQQEPQPAGGSLFQREWFLELDEMPEIISTFVTGDSAETKEQYNDATVFSFWGLYKLKVMNEIIPDMYGLHWIDCHEMRIEPCDLEDAFLDFWVGCMRFPVKPKFAAIEKKSTGVTLLSVLKKVQGLRVLDIERAGSANNKTTRFISMQPFIANKQITLPAGRPHTKMCIDHMAKITANNAHRFDDICDTAYDACKIAFIDKSIVVIEKDKTQSDTIIKSLASSQSKLDRLRKSAYKG